MPAIIATLPHLIAKHYKLAAFALLAMFAVYKSHQAAKWRDRAIACQMAPQAAAEATKALRAAEQAKAKETADHVQTEHVQARPASDDAADRYIRAHRVRTDHISAAEPVDQATSAAVPAPVPAQAVMVSEQDLRTCGQLYDYALDAHNWAVKVGE